MSNPKAASGSRKVPLGLVPPSASHYLAEALRDGAFTKGYGPFNWRTDPIEAMTYVSALKRHLDDWVDGEDLAGDSNVHHLAHGMACLAILLDAMTCGTLIDNRPPPGAATRLHAAFEAAMRATLAAGLMAPAVDTGD